EYSGGYWYETGMFRKIPSSDMKGIAIYSVFESPFRRAPCSIIICQAYSIGTIIFMTILRCWTTRYYMKLIIIYMNVISHVNLNPRTNFRLEYIIIDFRIRGTSHNAIMIGDSLTILKIIIIDLGAMSLNR